MFQFILEFVTQLYELNPDIVVELAVTYVEYAKTAFIFTVFLTISIFIFKSIAIFLMSKKNNLKLSALAFVPFANYYLLGKLAGEVKIFSLKVKNIGIWLGSLLLITFCLNTYIDIYCYYDEFYALISQNIIPEQITYVPGTFINICLIVSKIIYFVNIIFVVWFNIALLSKYMRKHSFWLSFLMILVYSNQMFYVLYSLTLAIIVMIIRNNKPFDINEYIARQRQNAQGSFNGYGTNQNQSQNSIYQTTVDDDPFDEFSSNNKNSNSTLEQDVFSDFTPNNDYSKNNDDNAGDNV